MNADQCYNLLGLSQGASMPQIRNAYRRLALEYHPDKNISSKDGMKFKLITEAYQTLRIKNMNSGRDSNSDHRNKPKVDPVHKKTKSGYYLNIFDDIIGYVKTACGYLLKYKPNIMAYYGLIQKHLTMSVCRLIRPQYEHVNSFISHPKYERLSQRLLAYLGIRS